MSGTGQGRECKQAGECLQCRVQPCPCAVAQLPHWALPGTLFDIRVFCCLTFATVLATNALMPKSAILASPCRLIKMLAGCGAGREAAVLALAERAHRRRKAQTCTMRGGTP